MKKQYVISAILEEMGKGIYIPGDEFESVRSLAKKYNVSHMTAYNVIGDLEEKGLIELRYKAKAKVTSDLEIIKSFVSHFQRPVQMTKKENLLNYLLSLESNESIVNLGTAINHPNISPVKEMLNQVGSQNTFFKTYFGKYSYAPGSVELRSHIAKLENERKNNIGHQDIILTNGAMESIGTSLRYLLGSRDKVLVCTPCFYGVIHLLTQIKNKVIEVKLENKLPVKEIENILKTEKGIKVGVFQSNFNNPTGLSYSETEKKELVKLFKKYSKYIIEDDTYSHLGFNGDMTTNLASYDLDKEVVFTCSSFSKTIGVGLNIGWLIPPTKMIDELINFKISYSFTTQLSNEKLVSHLLSKRNLYEKQLIKVRSIFKQNVSEIYSILTCELSSKCKITKPDGAFSIWIELPKNIDSFELYQKLIANNISITPGYAFSLNEFYKNSFRINCAVEVKPSVHKALKLICDVINQWD